MSTYAAVLTTGTWDPFVERQFLRAKTKVHSGDMFVIANETDGPLHVPHTFRQVTISETDISTLGLQILYDQTLFCHNADYYYIAFYHRYPRYDYYCFFEYPLLINTEIDALIDHAADNGIGLIAEPLDGKLEAWVYAGPHASVYPAGTLEGAMLPMVVLSNAALAYLMQRRLHLSQCYAREPDFFWPFCEAFVPTELKRAGFKAAPLSDYGSVDQFGWYPPILESALAPHLPPGFVHPVLDRPRYAATLLQHTRSRALFSKTTRHALSRHLPFPVYARSMLNEMLKRLGRFVARCLPFAARKKSALLWKAAARSAPFH